jgi:hypothetical protein
VTWQHPLTGRTTAVGLLTHVDSFYRFCYLRSAGAVAGFEPFLGFPDLERRYEATALFPLFAQRVMRRSRPDFDRYLHALRLEADASDWSILGRSQGQREGDGIRVFPEPEVDKAGVTTSTFFVNGLVHACAKSRESSRPWSGWLAGTACACWMSGPPPRARGTARRRAQGVALAWVPGVLLSHLDTIRLHGAPELSVVDTNGPDVPPAYRLLVMLRGTALVGYRPFDGPEWSLASKLGPSDVADCG